MTATTATAPIPLACVATAIPAAERAPHAALLARLFGTARGERREVAGGYRYRFDAAAFDDLARWIANERRCCPFLAFTLAVTPGGGPLWLDVTGPAGTRAFLDAELHAPRRTGDAGGRPQP